MTRQSPPAEALNFPDVELLIIAVQEDPSIEVRSLALRALVRLPLNPPVWFEVADLLVRALAPAVENHLAIDSRAEVTGLLLSELIDAAAHVPVIRVRKLLHDLLETEDDAITAAAAHALAKARDSAAVPRLLVELAYDDVERRYTAAKDLYPLDLGAARESLELDFSKESEGGVKMWLALALGRLGQAGPIQSVFAALSAGEIDLNLMRWHSDELFGLGPFPEQTTQCLREIAGDDSVQSYIREMAADLLADTTKAPAVVAGEPASPLPMRREADELARNLLQYSPFPVTGEAMYEAGEKLRHLTPAKLPALVTRLFQYVSEADFDAGIPATACGNFIMEMIRPLRRSFAPQVAPLFETFCRIRKKHYDVSMQLAWTVSRAELRAVASELIQRTRDRDAAKREAAMELMELSMRYRRQDYPPIFGGGSGPGDVAPESVELLDEPLSETLLYPPVEASGAEPGYNTAKPPDESALVAPGAEAIAAAPAARPGSTPEIKPPETEPEPVLLGAAAPASARPGDHFVALFAAYVQREEETVRAEFARRSRQAAAQLALESCRWALNTKVQVVLTGEHFSVDPPVREFVWQGGRNVLSFEVGLPPSAPISTTVLKFNVYIAGSRVAVLAIEMEINAAPAAEKLKEITVQPARRAFASYASADRLRVLDRVRSLEISAGIDVFQDCLDLHPGDQWKPRLKEEIQRRDIFILFWSKHARDSQWVTWEWELALAGRGHPRMDMQPLDPFAEVGAPPELGAVHMDDAAMIIRQYYEAHGQTKTGG